MIQNVPKIYGKKMNNTKSPKMYGKNQLNKL